MLTIIYHIEYIKYQKKKSKIKTTDVACSGLKTVRTEEGVYCWKCSIAVQIKCDSLNNQINPFFKSI